MNHLQKKYAVLSLLLTLAVLLAACTPPGAAARPASTPGAAPTRAATPAATAGGCSLAYVSEQHVYCQRSFAVRQDLGTAAGPVLDLSLSQDGRLVAYTVMQDDGTARLSVVRTDGTGAPLEVGAQQLGAAAADGLFSPFRLEWRAGTHMLYFNTIPNFVKGQVDVTMLPGADLWSLDGGSGELQNVVSRTGAGRFFLSPDGKHAVLSLPQALELMDLETGSRTQVLDFAALDNATPTGYLPRADWKADGTGFSVAIPAGKVLQDKGTAALYQVSLDGTVRTLGSLTGSFMAGGPIEFEFSPDGTKVAYGTLDMITLRATLHVALSDGTGDAVVDQFEREQGFIGLGWSPDSEQYIYSMLPEGGIAFAKLVSAGEAIALGKQVVAAQWTASDSFVFTDGSALYLYRRGEPERQVVGGAAGGMRFDVRPELALAGDPAPTEAAPQPTTVASPAGWPAPLYIFVRSNLTGDGPANQGVWWLDAGAAQVQRATPADVQVTAFALVPNGGLSYGTRDGKIYLALPGQKGRLLYDAGQGLGYPVLINGLGWSPDGKRLAYIVDYALEKAPSSDQVPETGLWLLSVENGESTQLVRQRYIDPLSSDWSEARVLTRPVWSPDGEALMVQGNYWEATNVLWLAPVVPDLEGKALRPAPGGDMQMWNHGAWSRDGRAILLSGIIMSAYSDLALVDRDTSAVVTLVAGAKNGLYVDSAAALPDGAAFVAWRDTDGGQGARLYRVQRQGDAFDFAPAGPDGPLCRDGSFQHAGFSPAGDLAAVSCTRGETRVVSLDGKVDVDLTLALGPLGSEDTRQVVWGDAR